MQNKSHPEILPEDLSKTGLYYIIKYSCFFHIILLVSVLKPHRVYKKILSRVLSLTFKFQGALWEVYHLLLVGIIFYGTIFTFLLFELSSIQPHHIKARREKLQALDRKWVKETMLWMTFIVIVCIATIYRNAALFTKEEKINNTLKELQKEMEEVKKEKSK